MSLFKRIGKLVAGQMLTRQNQEISHQATAPTEISDDLTVDEVAEFENSSVVEEFSQRRGSMSASLNDESEKRNEPPR